MTNRNKSYSDTPYWFCTNKKYVTVDLCVIGLGHGGLTVMKEAQELGKTTIGIDRGTLGGGASGRNAGLLVVGGANPFTLCHECVDKHYKDTFLSLYDLSLREITHFYEKPGIFSNSGLLYKAASKEEYADLDKLYSILRAERFPVEWSEGLGFISTPDCYYNPLEYLMGLQSTIGNCHFGTSVLGIDPTHNTLYTSGFVIKYDNLVIAIDRCLGEAFANVDDPAGVLYGYGAQDEILFCMATTPIAYRLSRPIYMNYGQEYIAQRHDKSIIIGGGRKFYKRNETHSSSLDGVLVPYLTEVLAKEIGRWDFKVTNAWSTLVGYTYNDFPYLSTKGNIHYMGGYSGTGNLLSYMCGKETVRRLYGNKTMLSNLLDPQQTTVSNS